MKVLIVIPAYNEEKSLPQLIPNIHAHGWETLIINDSSTDGEAELLDRMGWLHLDLPINAGLAAVTQMGFRYAYENGYDCAMVVDGDGQHPPKFIKDLIDEMEKGYDYVVGSRFVSEKKPMSMRMIGSRLLCLAIKLKTGRTVSDPTSGMRCLGKNVLKEFAENMNFVAEPDALARLIRKGYKISEVQVHMEDRTEGMSYFRNPFKSISFMYYVLMSILFLQ